MSSQNRSRGKSEGESETESLVARPLLLPGDPHWLLLKRLAYDLDTEFAGGFDANPLHVAKG